jgi:hypothetical protein
MKKTVVLISAEEASKRLNLTEKEVAHLAHVKSIKNFVIKNGKKYYIKWSIDKYAMQKGWLDFLHRKDPPVVLNWKAPGSQATNNQNQ